MDNSHSGLKSFNRWIFVPIFTITEQHLAEIQQKNLRGCFFYETVYMRYLTTAKLSKLVTMLYVSNKNEYTMDQEL